MVLVDNTWRVAAPADQPLTGAAPTAVRRAGESVLLPATREAPRPSAPAPLRLSKFHAPEIVFGPDSVQEAAHAAVRLGRQTWRRHPDRAASDAADGTFFADPFSEIVKRANS